MATQSLTKPTFSIYYLSERAVTIDFGQQIAEHLLDAISDFNALLHQHPFAGFCTTVPAYATLTVFFDPLAVIKSAMPGAGCFEKISGYLTNLNQQKKKSIKTIGTTVTIPVCYGGAFGPDLEELAHLHQLGITDVVKLHTSVIYTVYMIGFVPGFAYLGDMDERLATPRKAAPRPVIPAGSVGIAGQQTGVYPLQTPGGWQIIGQTPLKLFDATKLQPSLLKAGDKVVFKPINLKEFNQLASG
ncbi:MAG: Inhibitor of KinA [Mucilaginibacter sp.]|uniref:5-oxoprolinase subunit PxpB n=1 Tax=Mucilaginibacter sp. TaxID=1882438 RepID=UPI0026171B90|nr:5-oxoprolinase subunit PxpB [Mucilaginibacter sp.]MDB5003322.1 Inhibitor of KinA [Mucilaginibacter sp.]